MTKSSIGLSKGQTREFGLVLKMLCQEISSLRSAQTWVFPISTLPRFAVSPSRRLHASLQQLPKRLWGCRSHNTDEFGCPMSIPETSACEPTTHTMPTQKLAIWNCLTATGVPPIIFGRSDLPARQRPSARRCGLSTSSQGCSAPNKLQFSGLGCASQPENPTTLCGAIDRMLDEPKAAAHYITSVMRRPKLRPQPGLSRESSAT